MFHDSTNSPKGGWQHSHPEARDTICAAQLEGIVILTSHLRGCKARSVPLPRPQACYLTGWLRGPGVGVKRTEAREHGLFPLFIYLFLLHPDFPFGPLHSQTKPDQTHTPPPPRAHASTHTQIHVHLHHNFSLFLSSHFFSREISGTSATQFKCSSPFQFAT